MVVLTRKQRMRHFPSFNPMNHLTLTKVIFLNELSITLSITESWIKKCCRNNILMCRKSIVDSFKEKQNDVRKIIGIIDEINKNSGDIVRA
ncbi:hypothetical protein HMPREF1015_02927 [Bacillus smithii 7_3_47FAA]|uniref:Uncharacterized protein n=1 Tax=Bacillus smithii 7_3_47FAA TaxID=665952 RepID=G9QLB7_9BACI|nr:hypothetical protein HMPREF1015_02927 [Bacillus smithii 7_3_47FAA]